jgi:hypothetical protein
VKVEDLTHLQQLALIFGNAMKCSFKVNLRQHELRVKCLDVAELCVGRRKGQK